MSNIANFRCNFLILLLLSVGIAVEVRAAEPDEPIKLTLYPMAEPTPALKHRLLPEFIDRKPGNAAVFYGKVTAERTAFFRNRELWDKMNRWRSATLSELRTENAHVPLKPRFLKKAAQCRSCDWQLSLHEGQYFEMLLPEVQQTREFARILATQARIQVANKEFEQAIESFQIGFALANNVATGETLVHSLIGVAISGEMLKQVMKFVEQPDAPNLYWATTMLPRPFVDMRDGLEAEMSLFELSLPELRDLESKLLSPEDWQKMLEKFCYYFAMISDQDNNMGRAAIYLKMIAKYSSAKQTLIDQGYPTKEVERMSKEQVVSLEALLSFKQGQQEIGKFYHFPYPEAIQGMAISIENSEKEKSDFSTQARQGLMRTRKANARNTRRFEILRVVEALRIHAAANGGKLPAKLSDITEVPIPLDPVTGKPFDYRLKGKTASLTGPAILETPLNYEITMNPLPN